MKENVFYHITSAENARKILKEGLKPMIGKNSKMAEEQEARIYLCKRKDIPYWNIILGQSVVLKIKGLDEKELEYFKYHCYDEYFYYEPIEAKNISRVYIQKPTQEHMKKLCLYYISSFSKFCELCARYYNHGDDYVPFSYLDSFADFIILLTNNLDYSIVNKSDIRKKLKEDGEGGMYTLCDKYYETGKRLYNQLIFYPNDKLTEKREKIYRFIKKNFSYCLSVNTGGWCG